MNPATMTPEQLAEHGIPVVVALRARLEDATQRVHKAATRDYARYALGKVHAYRHALAILEAKGKR
jgi:hypothetical protein